MNKEHTCQDGGWKPYMKDDCAVCNKFTQLESSLERMQKKERLHMLERDKLRSRIWNLIRIGHKYRDNMMKSQSSLAEAREEIERLQKELGQLRVEGARPDDCVSHPTKE